MAMVCNFSSDRLRKKMHLSNYSFINAFRSILGHNKYKYKEFALWNEGIIHNCVGNNAIDLHVISPHAGLKKVFEEFELEGIHYYFYRNAPGFIIKYLNKTLFHQKLVKFKHNRRVVNGLISRINPDIIVLVGAETPYYSSTILDIDDKPLYALCQAVVTNPEFEVLFDKDTYRVRSNCERAILSKTKYVGVYNDKHHDLYRKIGYNGYIFRFDWPTMDDKIILLNCKKQYDFINFANVLSSEKGYHDCIEALAIVKKVFPDVRMALVEKTSKGKVKDELIALINQYDLNNNIVFIPFFENKEDLFRFIQLSRFAVLPCKVDYISGTMLQAMEYGLPTIVYETEGTPTINAKKETVLIAKKCDINDLANKMIELMSDENKASLLRLNGLEYMESYLHMKKNSMANLLENFRAIILNFTQGIEIPNEQLYLD